MFVIVGAARSICPSSSSENRYIIFTKIAMEVGGILPLGILALLRYACLRSAAIITATPA
jgi:hypothetical protein